MKKKNVFTSADIKDFWHDGWKDAVEKRKKEIVDQSSFEKVFFQTATASSFDSNTKFSAFVRYQFDGLQRQFARIVQKILLSEISETQNENTSDHLWAKILLLLWETRESVKLIISLSEGEKKLQHQAFFPSKEFFIDMWNSYQLDDKILEYFQTHQAEGFFEAWMWVILAIDTQDQKLLTLKKDILSFEGNKRDKTFRYHIVKVFKDERTIENIVQKLFSWRDNFQKIDDFLASVWSARVARKNIMTQSAYYTTRQQGRTYKKFDKTPE